MLRYLVSDYVAYIMMSNDIHLLVEGCTDQIYFEDMVQELESSGGFKNHRELHIDSVENFIDPAGAPGNSGVLKLVADQLRRLGQGNFVAFTDREFKGINVSTRVNDRNLGGKLFDNIFYSHGHSIENYFYIDELIKSSVTHINRSNLSHHAKPLIQKHQKEMFVHCATISIIVHELNINWKKAGVFNYGLFSINNDILCFDYEAWCDSMIKVRLMEFSDRTLNLQRLTQVHSLLCDPAIIANNLSHGHLGMIFIRHFIQFCIHHALSKNNTPNAAKHANDLACSVDHQFKIFSDLFITYTKNHHSVPTPMECFTHLNAFKRLSFI